MKYTVYKHTTPSEKVYIGITSLKVSERWMYGNGYKHNQYFYRAIKKYGWDNIKHEILFEGLTKEEAEQKEIELIRFYKSNDSEHGYNIENGGNSKGKVSEETKRKISEGNKGKILSLETRIKISKGNKGKTLSEETKNKISASLTGKTHSKEKGIKIGLSQLGNKRALGSKRTEEQKRKLSNALKGKKHSAEHNKHMGEAHMHSVICVETGVIYNSIKNAAKETGINKSAISHCCNGRNKTAGNYHWRFAESVGA